MKERIKAAYPAYTRDVIFKEAILPMEAAVLPAKERTRCGLLSMIPRAYDAAQRPRDQRAKIWVR